MGHELEETTGIKDQAGLQHSVVIVVEVDNGKGKLRAYFGDEIMFIINEYHTYQSCYGQFQFMGEYKFMAHFTPISPLAMPHTRCLTHSKITL